MTKEEKLELLNSELLDTQKEKQRFQDIIDFFSDGLTEDPGFYGPIVGSNRDIFLEAMQNKIDWLEEKIKEIQAL
jgi:hypothetical protein